MGRKFVVLAALAAFMVSMSACKCPTPSSSSGGGDGSNKAAAGTASSGTVCLDGPSSSECDGTACYRSEADRNMANLADCVSRHRYCGACNWKTMSCEERMPGTHRDSDSCGK